MRKCEFEGESGRLGRCCGEFEAWDVDPWEPHAKFGDWDASLSRTLSRPSPATAPNIRLSLAFGFEAEPADH